METLANNIQKTGKQLLDTVASFPQAEFNTVPFEGSWTAGQVADHVLKAASAMLNAMNGNTIPTERDPEQHVEMLHQILLNFDIKMKSPDFIIPSDDYLDQDELLAELKKAFDGIAEVAKTKELQVTCTDLELPNLGVLTRTELINFIDVHTQRHIHQLHQIEKHLAD